MSTSIFEGGAEMLDVSGMRELSKPLSDEDKEWLRNWNREDLIEAEEADGDEGDDGDVEDGYDSWKVKDLKTEIEGRNSERGEDDQITVEEPGNKPELVAALEADDEAHPE